MSQETPFAEMAAAVVDLANGYGTKTDQRLVGVAVLHAAARYNAFVCATTCKTAEEMASLRGEHIGHFVKQFQEFLEHHYDDYAQNFDAYLVKSA